MKSSFRYTIPLFGVMAALPLVVRAETGLHPLAGAEPPHAGVQHRGFVRAIGGPGETMALMHAGEKEIVTFLGVETGPVSPTLTAQLGLPKEAGLVIRNVAPNSPAASALKPHDILLKLDDQLLVEPRQFSVLIRNHKEGDEVTLTYVRAGKQATAKTKLSKQEVPKMAMAGVPFGAGTFDVMLDSSGGPVPPDEMDRVLGLIRRAPGHSGLAVGAIPFEHGAHIRQFVGPGFRATNVNPGNSNMVYSDDQGSLDLTIKEGKKTLIAKDPKGETVFSGPVNTPEERKALPAGVRERLDKLEGMQEFGFKTDEDFKPGATRIVRPLPQGIAWPSMQTLPLPPPSPVF
jgi:serine protease Do